MLDVGISSSLHLAKSWGLVHRKRAEQDVNGTSLLRSRASGAKDNRERDGLAGDVICPTGNLG